jgi:hypothetical protein
VKVAITCDHLLGRNHYTEIIESLCEIFPEAPIYCFAHRKGKILGHIEQRSIKSTYLSNIVTTEEEFLKHAHKLPSLAKNLFVSCDYDLIINVSKGFSQGIKRCDKSKLLTYLYDLDVERKIKNGFVQKLFFAHVKSWIEKTLKNTDFLFVTREDLAVKLKPLNKTIEVMPPPFRVSDYALFPKAMFKHHFYLIEADGLSLANAEKIADWMKEWNKEFQFVGNDEHLASMKANHKESAFFGNRCSGEHAPVMAASKALISFNTEVFPLNPLATLATGRPVIVTSELKKWMNGVGITFIDQLDKESFKAALDNVEANEDVWEGQKLRAHVMEYHDVKFKAAMKRALEKLGLREAPAAGHTCTDSCSH